MLFRILGIALFMVWAQGCSDSQFQGGVAKKSKGESKSLTGDDQVANDNDLGDDANLDGADGSDGENTTGEAGDYNVNNNGDLDDRNESADRNEADFETLGCKFPKDVKEASGDSSNSFELGWGGTSSEPRVNEAKLTNLDPKDCEWFDSQRTTTSAFMLVFDDGSQSYAEPFEGGLNLFFGSDRTKTGGATACHKAARDLMMKVNARKISGKVVCSTIPREVPSALASDKDD